MQIVVSDPEYRVACLLYEHGWNNAEIAKRLNRTNSTVWEHIHNLCKKTSTNSAIALMAWMHNNTLVSDTTVPVFSNDLPKGLQVLVRPAEYEYALQLYQGLTCTEIAKKRFVALGTVSTQIARIRKKTGVNSNRRLMAWLHKNQLIPFDNRCFGNNKKKRKGTKICKL